MTASAITFAVRVGSGGAGVARLVSERLMYRYYDWEVTSEAARQAGVSPAMISASERAHSLMERFIERLSITGTFEEAEPAGRLTSSSMATAIQALSSAQYREFVERVVYRLAEAGDAVIVGHAGQVVLQDRPDVLKVLVTGSSDMRAERLMLEEGIGLKQARTSVTQSDAERASFFKQTYHIDLLDPSLYDLTLNTDKLPEDVAAAIVINAAGALPGLIEEQEKPQRLRRAAR